LPGFVSPRRIALIGGSSARLKVGGLVARYLLKDDLVLVQLGTNADPSAAVMATMLAEIHAASPVPFLVSRLGSPHLAPAAVEIYAAAGIPVFGWPGQLAAAAAASVTFGTVIRHKPAGDYGAIRPLRSA